MTPSPRRRIMVMRPKRPITTTTAARQIDLAR